MKMLIGSVTIEQSRSSKCFEKEAGVGIFGQDQR